MKKHGLWFAVLLVPFLLAQTDVGDHTDSGGNSGGAPSGAAGGDLSGTYPDPSVVGDSHDHTGTTVSALDGGDLTTGQVAPARGGTGQDSSASSGVPEVNAGTWSFGATIGDLAASTSAALLGVLSDETGTGLAVFNQSPTIVTPTIASFANAAHDHDDAAGGGQFNATNVFSAGTVPTARLGSGTADGTTFLRGDQTWATPAGGGAAWSESQKGKAADPCGAEAAEQFTRNQHPLIRFEDGTATTKQCACWEFVLSDDYAGGGITVEHWFTAATATSGTMNVEAAWERQNTDLDADSFATAVAANWTPNATSGIPDVEVIAFTNGAQVDDAVAGDRVRYQICRDADDATNDTMVGYGEILQVRWSETP